MGTYKVGQVCREGHAITSDASNSEFLESYCSTCGTETIMACPNCDAAIRGRYDVEGVFTLGETYTPPRFCYSCGEAFPWTVARLHAASEVADELDELNAADRATLKRSIEELAREAPSSQAAGLRVKKIMRKAGAVGSAALYKLLVDVLSETAKKSIGLGED